MELCIVQMVSKVLNNIDQKRKYTLNLLYMTTLSPASQWIYKQFIELENELAEHLQNYTIGHSIDALYKYLWDNYADWYLEYLKTDETQKEFARELLREYIILLHPYMPYETEVLWKEFANETELLALKTRDQGFVTNYEVNESDVEEFESIKLLIESLRSMRGLFAIDPATKLTVNTNSDTIVKYAKYLNLLGKTDVQFGEQLSYVVGESNLQISIDIQHYIPDISIEINRTHKLILGLEKQIAGLNAKLNNQKFIENAEEQVILEAKENLNARQQELLAQQTKLAILDNS